jgi:hypothetical protein
MRTHAERSTWVAYARVSTAEQAEKDLSLPAQCGFSHYRKAVLKFRLPTFRPADYQKRLFPE